MKFWLLTWVEGGGYDTFDAFVVVAPDEATARDVIDREGAGFAFGPASEVTCVELRLDDYAEAKVVLGSFNAG